MPYSQQTREGQAIGSASLSVLVAAGCLLVIAAMSGRAWAEDQAAPVAPADPSIDMTIDAAEADGAVPKRVLTSWNEYDGPYFSLRVGGGLGYDTAGYAQDEDSKEQLDLVPKTDLRDFRFVFKGKLKFIEGLTYCVGHMYDKPNQEWLFRQTGLMLDVPALYGDIFVGRGKEGFSTSRIMVGYQGWTMERAAINDALLPILADGIKWSGYVPSGEFVYNIGWFGDRLSETQAFNRNDMAVAARAVWLPLAQTNEGVLHLALEGRFSDADDGFLQYRAKPEVGQAQSYAIDTGKFAAQHAVTLGIEAYYRPGPLMFGMEYFFNKVSSREAGDPFFHGGEVFVSYTLTGEPRPYNARGAFFERMSPAQSVFEDGPGAWDVTLRFSYADLDDKAIDGGKFWRITPIVNWHLSDNVRLEFEGGYGMLDRFDQEGGTVFVQSRILLQL